MSKGWCSRIRERGHVQPLIATKRTSWSSRGEAKRLSRASVDRVACWGQHSAASGAIARADTDCFAWCDECAPTPAQRNVDTEAAQGGADGPCEAGARAKLILQTDENDAAAILAEEARLGTVEVCPVANVTELVVAQPAG